MLAAGAEGRTEWETMVFWEERKRRQLVSAVQGELKGRKQDLALVLKQKKFAKKTTPLSEQMASETSRQEMTRGGDNMTDNEDEWQVSVLVQSPHSWRKW